jgi:hypothetical protein
VIKLYENMQVRFYISKNLTPISVPIGCCFSNYAQYLEYLFVFLSKSWVFVCLYNFPNNRVSVCLVCVLAA